MIDQPNDELVDDPGMYFDRQTDWKITTTQSEQLFMFESPDSTLVRCKRSGTTEVLFKIPENEKKEKKEKNEKIEKTENIEKAVESISWMEPVGISDMICRPLTECEHNTIIEIPEIISFLESSLKLKNDEPKSRNASPEIPTSKCHIVCQQQNPETGNPKTNNQENKNKKNKNPESKNQIKTKSENQIRKPTQPKKQSSEPKVENSSSINIYAKLLMAFQLVFVLKILTTSWTTTFIVTLMCVLIVLGLNFLSNKHKRS